MWWLYVPILIISVVLVVFLLLLLLGRYKNGALLRPVITKLSQIGFMRRFFTRVSTAAIERQNPELASALKKINPVASNPNPQAVQKAMSRLTPAERRAYMEAAQEQGAVPGQRKPADAPAGRADATAGARRPPGWQLAQAQALAPVGGELQTAVLAHGSRRQHIHRGRSSTPRRDAQAIRGRFTRPDDLLARARDIGREPGGRPGCLARSQRDEDRGERAGERCTDVRRERPVVAAEETALRQSGHAARRLRGVLQAQRVGDVPRSGAPGHAGERAREL